MNKKHYIIALALIFSAIAATVISVKRQSANVDVLADKNECFDHAICQLSYDQVESRLFDGGGRPTKELSQLLDVLKLEHSGTLQDIVDVTQKRLLGPTNRERWEFDDPLADKKEELLPLFKKLGLIDEIRALKTHYDYVFLLGSRTESVRKRLKFLIDEWNRGVRFNTIVLLTGHRLLTVDEKKELSHMLQSDTNIPETEVDMMRILYAAESLPADMAKIPVHVVFAPAKPGAPRATTEDTIKTWLSASPLPGTILAVSSQPFVHYQHTVLDTYLPQVFLLETIGPEDSGRSTVAVILDNVARWIYQESKRRQV